MSLLLYERSAELLFDQLNAEAIRQWLVPIGFSDWRAAHRQLLRMGEVSESTSDFANMLPYLLLMLTEAANPDRALINLERFIRSAQNPSTTVRHLAQNPRDIEILIKLFEGSQFLTEILLRNPEYFEQLTTYKYLAHPKTTQQLSAEINIRLRPETSQDLTHALNILRCFQRREFLRIGACDLLGLFDLPLVTRQLSNLADSLIRTSLVIASEHSQIPSEGFVVLAMGKLGGQELNYSSDIDLLFLASENTENYRRLGEKLIEILTYVTAEGFLYRVDMRLRPWGQVGALISSLDGYLTYMKKHARIWEKQALLKARAVAGDESVEAAFMHHARPLIFDISAQTAREHVYAMKQRTESYLRQQGREWGEVKLGQGSIRDVEFVAQYLQLAYGEQHPQICSRNTLDGLTRLSATDLLALEDYRILSNGYMFLRTVEHHLQMMHYRQTHRLPDSDAALAHLARRLGFQNNNAGPQFLARYEQHRAAIRNVYLHYLGSDTMEKNSQSPSTLANTDHISRMDPSYTTIFTAEDIKLHTTMANKLDEDHQVRIHATPLTPPYWRVTLVGYDYPGELSLICGLLFVYGLDIQSGHVFTYEPTHPSEGQHLPKQKHHRKIVDVFTIRPVKTEITKETWQRYSHELTELLNMTRAGQRREARGKLAQRVTEAIPQFAEVTPTLYPIEITIDNRISDLYTVLRINTPDTIGFLYEFANALAYSRIYIARVTVNSFGNRVHDVLYITDAHGKKITHPEKQRELRAATVLIKHFTHLLPHSPNPGTALLHFREFISQLFTRPNWPNELTSLERPEVLDALAQLLGVSDFLWDDFLRMQHANLFPVVRDVDTLESAKSRKQLQHELETRLHPVHNGPQDPNTEAHWRTTLNAFKDREMFRIDMRHILGHTREFGEFSEELTALAEVVVNAAYHLNHEDLRAVYGTPYLENGEPSEMTVCALGKCGGRELGFASDIELMFIYSGNGYTTGPQVITTAEFYEKIVQIFISTIQAKREGIFEIDLQLRPYGKSGSLAVSLESFQRYFAPDGPAWAYERQALVKLRPIAGNLGLGQHVVQLRDQFIYHSKAFDVAAMRAMRERQIRHLVTGGTFNAKYSPGGLVDVEYLVQGLQMRYGDRIPDLRQTNVRQAMAALTTANILPEQDYVQLRKAHTFLQWLIDGLRIVRGNAKDLTVPPADSEAFIFLARRLRYGNDAKKLHDELIHYTNYVQALNIRLLQ